MAGYLNKVTLIGNVGADPEIKNLTSGGIVGNLSLATTESWKDKATGEKKERTEWHRIVVWSDGLCNVIEQYVRKGSRLYIEGELQTRKWEKDGIERYSTEIVLTGFNSKLILLGDPGGKRAADPNGNASRPGNDGGGEQRNGYADAHGRSARGARQPAGRNADMDDEIPF